MPNLVFLTLLFSVISVSSVFSSELRLERFNLMIKSCETYPYYDSQIEQTEGNTRLKNDFLSSLSQTKTCLNNHDFAPFVVDKFQHFFEIIEGTKEKILTCNYGVTNSYYAVASSLADELEQGGQDHGLPPHPSVLFDTNRMAGNFPVYMTEAQRNNFVLFYNHELRIEDVIPGTRNPRVGFIENPRSLVFHEMFHWTGSSHFPKKYVDIVYLTQFCCFPQVEHSAEEVAFACELLEEEAAWQEDEQKRVQFLEDFDIQSKVKALIQKYH